MSLGIALGAAAKSGMDTYERLSEEARRKTAAQREEDKFQREEAIRTEAGLVSAPGTVKDVVVGMKSRGPSEQNNWDPDAKEGEVTNYTLPAAVAPKFVKAWQDFYASQEEREYGPDGISRIGPPDSDAARKIGKDADPDQIVAPSIVIPGSNARDDVSSTPGAIQTDATYARELAGRIRQYDPQQSMALLGQAGQFETQALSQGQMKRQERYEQRKEAWLRLQHLLPAAESDEKIRKTFLKEAADLATMAEDNGAAGWKVNIDGTVDPPMVIASNPVMGQKQYIQMPLKDIVTHLGKYLTPDTAQYQEQRSDQQQARKEDVAFREQGQRFTETNAAEMRRLEALRIEMVRQHYKAMEARMPPNQIALLNNKEGKRLRDEIAAAQVALEDAAKSKDPTQIMLARLAYAGASRNLGAHVGKVDLDFDKEIFGPKSMDPATAAKLKVIENDPNLSADEKEERIDRLMKGDPYENAVVNLPPKGKPGDVKVPAAIERRAPVQGTSQEANEAGAKANIERERTESTERAIKMNARKALTTAITEALRRGDKAEADKLGRDLQEFEREFKLPTQSK